MCYTVFAVEIPVAGGSFSHLRIELGDFVAYIAAGNILLEAVVGAAGLGRSWSSYFASIISSNTNLLRFLVQSLPDGFNLLDPVAVVVILVANGIAMSGTSRTSILNWITSIASVVVVVFIIAVGFSHGKTSNLKPFFPYGAEGVFKASALVYWSYTGVATMAEVVKRPSKDIPRYTQISADVAYSAAFQAIGMNRAKYLVSICALKGMTTSMLVCSLGQARKESPRFGGVPLVPWLPAVSIGINVFLNGSLGYLAFLRFAICTAVMVVYYLLVGVHATYDVAHQIDQQESRTEDGNAS
ncbi:hypothetical protein ACLB2K_028754 [Fragaria x ananassa]